MRRRGGEEILRFFEGAVFVAGLPFTGFAVWSAIELSSLMARGLIHYYPISQTKR